MKKYLLLSAVACTLAGCSNDFNPADVVVDKGSNTETKEAPIGFSATNKNMLRATNGLQDNGHYNFGVFAHKSGGFGTETAIMEDYLVGYMDASSKKGYYMASSDQTTLGNSNWSYEKLGSNQYSYTGSDGYYQNTAVRYMSNHQNQWLRYWDYTSTETSFYAYTPYVNNNDVAKRVKFDNTNKRLTFPDGVIAEQYGDDYTGNDYMYAAKTVAKASYENEVGLEFKRIHAKIQIGFYETIEGYSVKIVDLKDETSPGANDGIQGIAATPANYTSSPTPTYTYGKLYKDATTTISFSNMSAPVISYANQTPYNSSSSDFLKFKAPTDAPISKTNPAPSMSSTIYYGLPKDIVSDECANTGLTFHVSFVLTSEDGASEQIKVYDAKVFVSNDNCRWQSNKSYKYIFKITKNTSGSTSNPGTISGTNPDPGTGNALFPIVFDGCTVEDWEVQPETEHDINQ